MSEEQCNHAVWLERILPQLSNAPYWLMHNVRDGDPPNETVTDNIFFNYCPLCGANLKAKSFNRVCL